MDSVFIAYVAIPILALLLIFLTYAIIEIRRRRLRIKRNYSRFSNGLEVEIDDEIVLNVGNLLRLELTLDDEVADRNRMKTLKTGSNIY